jgi:photosystem II stability/assembly factor-like uncharacterized protein
MSEKNKEFYLKLLPPAISLISGIIVVYIKGDFIPMRVIEVLIIFLSSIGIFYLWKGKGQTAGITASILLLCVFIGYLAWMPVEKDSAASPDPAAIAADAPVVSDVPEIYEPAPVDNAADTPASPGLLEESASIEEDPAATQTSIAVVEIVESPSVEKLEPKSSPPWLEIKDLPGEVSTFAVDPDHPNIIYAGIKNGGIFRSDDAGINWIEKTNGMPLEEVMAITVTGEPVPAIYTVLGRSGLLYQSIDEGDHWEVISKTGLWTFDAVMRTAPASNQVYFIVYKSETLAISRDGGYLWEEQNDGLPFDEYGTWIMSLAVDPADSNILYAGTGDLMGAGRGVYKSMDGGQNWAAANKAMAGARILSIEVSPHDGNIIFAGGDKGDLFKSSDGGQSWLDLSDAIRKLNQTMVGGIHFIAFDPHDSKKIFLVVENLGLVMSADGGEKWRRFSLPPDLDYFYINTAIILFADNPIMLLCARQNGSWRFELSQ